MKLYATVPASRIAEIKRFVGKDVWVKCLVPHPSTDKWGFCWVRFLNTLNEGTSDVSFEVNILQADFYCTQMIGWAMDKVDVLKAAAITVVTPVDTLSTEELYEDVETL